MAAHPAEDDPNGRSQRISRELNRTDRAILRELRADSRLSNRELSRRIGLSPPSTQLRVQRLEETGAIRGFTIETGPAAHGALVAYVGVRVAEHTRAHLERFEDRVTSIEEVVSMSQVTGAFDYLLRVEVDDLDAYRRFHTTRLAAVAGVAQVTTFVVVKDFATGIRADRAGGPDR